MIVRARDLVPTPPKSEGPKYPIYSRGDKEFGEKLKKLREEFGLTQQQVNEALGFGTGSLQNYEQARHLPSTENLVKLAIFYDVTLDDLCGPLYEKELRNGS